MFHVLLALPVLAAFGAMAVVVLSVVLAIWGAAFAIELALGLLCRRNRWCLWIPAVVGAVGMLLMLLARMYPLELPFKMCIRDRAHSRWKLVNPVLGLDVRSKPRKL